MTPDSLPTGPKLVVGLGNPGSSYERTRHNVGFMVADVLAARMGERFRTDKRSGGLVVDGRLGIDRVLLLKPMSFMNVSGRPVAALARFNSIDVERLVVVHDELDLDPGTIRLKRGGGEGGHNGLRSISQAMGSKDYLRVRVGIGRPPGRQDPADYVLKPFSSAERKDLPVLLEEAADAVETLLELGLEGAQNRLH